MRLYLKIPFSLDVQRLSLATVIQNVKLSSPVGNTFKQIDLQSIHLRHTPSFLSLTVQYQLSTLMKSFLGDGQLVKY